MICVVVMTLVAAMAGAALYWVDAEHDRTVLRDLLWVGQTIYPGQPATVAGSALQERGFQKAFSDNEHEARYVKMYPNLPWGASIDVRLPLTEARVDVISVKVVDTKSGRPYRP